MQFPFFFALAMAILSSVSTGQLLPPSIVPVIQPCPTGAATHLVSGSFSLEPMPTETAYPASGSGDGDDDEGDEDGDDEDGEESPVITGSPEMPGGDEPKTLDPEPTATPESSMMSAPIMVHAATQGTSSVPDPSSLTEGSIPNPTSFTRLIPEPSTMSASIMIPSGSHGTSSVPDPSSLTELLTLDPTSFTRLIPEPSTMSASIMAPRATEAFARRRRQARQAGYSMTTSRISIPDPTSLTQMLPESSMPAMTLVTMRRQCKSNTNGASSPAGVYPSPSAFVVA
ncbi:hypothetical protein MGYG_05396 [Nannizzia gypsea CBS 118893]|uniref:Uncharacterized protein n=1 Tax=Arthroderma gypseum (strain ATCC MYA-4604 / CBS 118893) TaxID=535722 RepID=E4UVS2_ARTGP|nr:hypothetical protein MGYG_05396 [Nannizzia gypsea CBS 118893]EFR02399.1 hypothetical protein MGYG_05396 [Nannizzia gypsea CBS 118893]